MSVEPDNALARVIYGLCYKVANHFEVRTGHWTV